MNQQLASSSSLHAETEAAHTQEGRTHLAEALPLARADVGAAPLLLLLFLLPPLPTLLLAGAPPLASSSSL